MPCVVDLAAMRDAMIALGGNPDRVNPLQPVELVIDHSVQVDYFAPGRAFSLNAESRVPRATASATPSCAGASARSTTSRWC